ncbi:MAG: glycerate kinase [Candidatus Acetothermia bacterium]|jgi:glycerate kinase|nr:glycerate kinase [Candidatus Acetothermia bacterium]MDH7505363.1 glycerate kinase [Candidatus Acetothermia bacterium]
MKVLIAPGPFKGSLSAPQAAEAIARGFKAALPQAELELVPLADGGTGTVAALVAATKGRLLTARVHGPLGEPVEASWGLLGDGTTAVIEMAAAAGLWLVPPGKRNPLKTTTYGVGELVRAALAHSPRRIIIGLGDSATVDGGAGLAQALGVGLLDSRGEAIPRGNEGLARLARLELGGLDSRLKGVEVLAACDVENPLLGPEGAASVYGPQKGATPEMVPLLERNLEHLAGVITRELGREVAALPGAGAAGGLGAGLAAFLGAELRLGIELIKEVLNFEARLADADLVITGEGQVDRQTAFGKAPLGVARSAKRSGKPVICFAGAIGSGAEGVYAQGIDALVPIVPGPISPEEALARAEQLLEEAAARTARLLELAWQRRPQG